MAAVATLMIGLVDPTWRTATAATTTSSPSSSTAADMTIAPGDATPPAVDGGVGTAAAIGCGLGVRALILVGPIFGLVLATVAVCTLALFEGAVDPSP